MSAGEARDDGDVSNHLTICEAGQQEHLRLIKFHQWDKYWPFHSKSASSPSTTTELTGNFRGSYRGGLMFLRSLLKERPQLSSMISLCLKRVMGWHFNLIFPRCKIPIFLWEKFKSLSTGAAYIKWNGPIINQGYGHGIRHLHAFPLDSEGWTLPILMSHFLYCRKVYLTQNISYMATLSSKDWLARHYCHFCDGTQQPPFCFWKFNTSCIFPDCLLREQFLSPVLSADNCRGRLNPNLLKEKEKLYC